MTQIGIGLEKGKQEDNAQLILNGHYIVQPHLQKKKPSALLLVIAIILTICVIITTVLGIVWLVRTHLWLSELQPTPTQPTPFADGVLAQDVRNDQAFSFDDIWNLRPKSFSGQWLNQDDKNRLIYRDEFGNLVWHDFDDGGDGILVPNTTFIDNGVTRYYPNHDGRYVLLAYNENKIWRHSFTAQYFIWDTQNSNRIEFPYNQPVENNRVRHAAWAPGSNDLVFVQDNNIYHQGGPNVDPVRITTDGNELRIFNGVPDWLYEEDVLSSSSASYFSDDGQFLVFGKFDVTDVPLVEYPLYLPVDNPYSRPYQAAYPMAGARSSDGTGPGPNTIATLHVISTGQNDRSQTVAIPPPPQWQTEDHYFTRVAFVNPTTLAVTWTNRLQNEAYVYIYTLAATGNNQPTVTLLSQLHHTTASETGWIDSPWPAPIPDIADPDDLAYFTYFMDTNSVGKFKHVAHVNVTDGEDNGFLTHGPHEVLGLVAYDVDNDHLYYYSTNGTQRNRHLMRLTVGEENSDICITCALENCEYVSAQFSPSADYFLLSCLGPGIPHYEVMNTTSSDANSSSYVSQRVMEDNHEFGDQIELRKLPVPSYTELDLNGTMASTLMFEPPDHNDGGVYPLLVYVYAGPGSLQVTSRYPYGSTINNWLRHLGSEYNIGVALVDGRGTMGRGEEFKFQMYRRLADIEIVDQMQAVGKLQEQFRYLNREENVAVFGWSYGGFVSSLLMGQNDTTYGCGVAVAPVTSKKYYDTAYTERYMRFNLEDDNAAGYDRTDVFPLAPNFKNKKYFIAHGTHDDNVHFRHFTNLVWALTEEGVNFQQQIYIDQDHSIRSPNQERHLFYNMEHFLNNECFTYVPPPEPTTPAPTSNARATHSSIAILTAALLVLLSILF